MSTRSDETNKPQMNNRHTKSLASRVSLLIGIVITLVAVLVLASGLYTSRLLSEGRDRLELEIRDQADTQTLQNDMQKQVSSFRGYIAYGRDEFLSDFVELQQSFDEKLKETTASFDARKTGKTAQIELLERFQSLWEQYRSATGSMIALKKVNEMEAIEQLSVTKATPLITDMNRTFAEIEAIQRNVVDQLLEDNRKRTQLLVWLSVAVVAGAAALGWLLVRYLQKTAILPILRVDRAVNEIAEGRYVVLPESGRNDEIGTLERGVSSMSNELKRRHVELENTNRELLEQRDLLEAQYEEITAQQIEQQEMLLKLTERERELELIASYQEKLTGRAEMDEFLKHAVPALLHVLRQDAAVLIVENPETAGYEVAYAYGYPPGALPSSYSELYRPSRRMLVEKEPIYRTRRLTADERGIHGAYETALDQYYPLLDEYTGVIGILLLTSYGTAEMNDVQLRLSNGLVRQFALAYRTQKTNEERRKQAYLLEELNEELGQERDSLQQQRDLVRTIIESIHEGMVMCDGEGRVLFNNDRMNEMFGFDRYAGLNIREFCRRLESMSLHKSQLREYADSVMKGMLGRLQERFTIASEDGRQRSFELYVHAIVDPIEQNKSFLFVFRDRTDEEKADEAKNEFISIVSHELRTPLASVLGFMEILLHRDIPKEKQKKYMDTIYKEANRLSNLINDFLDLQRMESGKQAYRIVPVHISALVREVADQWQDKQGHRARLDIDPKIYVNGDTDRLKQVLHNLFSNAVKYSPGADSFEVRVFAEGEQAVIEVQDFGLGIPEDAKDKLFSKFYRVDNSDRRQIGGTGLGLAIVKEIIDSHNGTISFESALGKGTTFRIELATYRTSGLSGKVVIVEDDENLSKLVAVAFEKLQLPTVQIRSAEDAIMSLREKSGGAPLLCIVDIQLEGAMSGWDFIAELLRDPVCSSTPVIVSTVLEPPKHFHETDTEKFLRKPFTVERLLELSAHLIGGQFERSPVVFPAQDRSAIALGLEEKGFHIAQLKIQQDIIQVEVNNDGELDRTARPGEAGEE